MKYPVPNGKSAKEPQYLKMKKLEMAQKAEEEASNVLQQNFPVPKDYEILKV